MKKLLIFSWILIVFVSCSDLEVEPRNKYSDHVAWQNQETMDMYVVGLYAALRDQAEIYNNRLSDGLSDIFKYSVNNLNANTFQNKVLLEQNYINPSSTGGLNEWDNYGRIKRQNEFLLDVHEQAGHIDSDFVNIRIAEVKFLRAYLYYKMIRNHGGVILRLHNSGVDGGLDSEKDRHKARVTEAESWDFVIKELEEVAKMLEGHEWEEENYGRVNAAAAHALLTRCALYAGEYDRVISAGQKVEALGYELEPNYRDVFRKIDNKEVILPVLFKKPNYTHKFDRYFGPSGDFANFGGWGGPTEELVSQYRINIDGEYVDFDWSNPLHKAKPYDNREPRFYASILYNGAVWRGRTIESFVGGRDGFVTYDFNSDNTGNVTGYFVRKFLQEGNEEVDRGSDSYWVELRHAEVLLNMAEAYAAKEDYVNAYAYLNKVRTRGAHLKPLDVSSTYQVFMLELERERMLELAFEGHRYWDLRRWRRAQDLIHGKRAHGVKITHLENGQLRYNVVEVEDKDRYFPESYYYIPIPQSEVSNNHLCEQTFPW